jgi:hypothetical protein
MPASLFDDLALPMPPAHHTPSRLHSRVPQSLWRSSATTSIRAPLSPLSPLLAGGGFESMVGTRTGVLPCLWCGLKGAPLYLGDSGDGDDAHERGHLRAYSRQGAPLLRRLSYPFNLTRRTRRTKQRVPYLCSFSTYAWYRVFSNCLITRRRHPTRRMIPRRVGREHRRAATRTRRLQTPYLCRILRPSSGSSGFVETWEPPTGNAGVVL